MTLQNHASLAGRHHKRRQALPALCAHVQLAHQHAATFPSSSLCMLCPRRF